MLNVNNVFQFAIEPKIKLLSIAMWEMRYILRAMLDTILQCASSAQSL